MKTRDQSVALRVALYSLAILITLYLTVILLPERLNINENASRALFIITVAIFFSLLKEKWWIKTAALILGLVGFFIQIILFVP